MKDKIKNILIFMGTSISKLCVMFVFAILLLALNTTSLCGCRDTLNVLRDEYNRLLIDAYKGQDSALNSFIWHYKAWSHSAVALKFYDGFTGLNIPYFNYEIAEGIRLLTKSQKQYISHAHIEKNLKTALFLMKTSPNQLAKKYKNADDEKLIEIWRKELEDED